MQIKLATSFLIFFFLIISGLECKKKPTESDDNTPKYVQNIFLSVEDTSITELTLKVAIAESVEQRAFIVKRDTQTILFALCSALDTTFTDTALLPNHNYTYKAYRLKNNIAIDSSTLHVTTMDTTSHDFIWTVDTIGVRSYLYDVAIIENEIWIVGQVFLSDSSGQLDPNNYNLVRGSSSGNEWEIERILFPICDANGNEINTASFATSSVFAFSVNDIWITDGGSFVHWNGSTFQRMCLRFDLIEGAIQKLWGTTNNDIYAVGGNGTIIYYDGISWQKKESDTDIDLRDVWGGADGSNLWACGYRGDWSESILLHSTNGTIWEEYGHAPPWNVYQDLFSSVWFPRNDSAYVVGNWNIFRHSPNSPTGYKPYPLALGNFPYRIRGNDRNDVVIVGDDGMIWHFNGKTWKRYSELFNPRDILYSVSIYKNTIVAVGERYYNGIRYMGLIYKAIRN
jgi:hypothetical protein